MIEHIEDVIDSGSLSLKITDEGIIIDAIDDEGEVVGCVGRTFEEWFDHLVPEPRLTAVEVAGELLCPGCGSNRFGYEEDVADYRTPGGQHGRMVRVVWDIGNLGDGLGDPGLVCDKCRKAIDLPEGWEIDFA